MSWWKEDKMFVILNLSLAVVSFAITVGILIAIYKPLV